MEFLEIGFIELIDIGLVAVLIYQLYKLVRGTVAINIFIGLAAIYLLWKIVDAFHFQLLSEILGQFIGVGVIILVIVFQQELRKFLMFIGKGKLIKNKSETKAAIKAENIREGILEGLKAEKLVEKEEETLEVINKIMDIIDTKRSVTTRTYLKRTKETKKGKKQKGKKK